jgi:hypothetical protein
MTHPKQVLHDLEIENIRVVDLLYDDFNAYQASFDAGAEDSAHQDLRASFLSWMMTFAPEVFPPDLALEIASFVGSAQDQDDYAHYGWHNTLHLRAGMFALTRNYDWLDQHIGNLSHHNSSLRGYVARSLAPVIHLVSSGELDGSICKNLEEWHFFNVYPLSLFVAALGDVSYKVRRLSEWARQYPDGNDSTLFAALLSGKPMENAFAPQFSRVERYVLLRLCSRPQHVPIQRVASWGEPASDAGLRHYPDARVDANVILERIENHPLSGGFIETLEEPNTPTTT